ncbi:hypothetical protein, partial [Bacteroides stercoris]|uniref:hypothetical protein n=1 Tax=Bacteroides stercoris TaxID=46506 RepID=UPI0021AB2A39
LCHSEILMPKDTESLGNNKAPACESRGFVRKIMKVCILTHLLFRLYACHVSFLNLFPEGFRPYFIAFFFQV